MSCISYKTIVKCLTNWVIHTCSISCTIIILCTCSIACTIIFLCSICHSVHLLVALLVQLSFFAVLVILSIFERWLVYYGNYSRNPTVFIFRGLPGGGNIWLMWTVLIYLLVWCWCDSYCQEMFGLWKSRWELLLDRQFLFE